MKTWQDFLEEQSKQEYFQSLLCNLEKEYQENTIYPPKEDLYNAFQATPLDQVKVVILGQDPYHNENQAHGFAFSVQENTKIPPSLANIYKEIEQEYQIKLHRSGNLEDWAQQGVLLLNPILSVRAHQPLSHKNLGWTPFFENVLKVLNEAEQPIVFLLWGGQAQKASQFLNNPNHLILKSAHPSPLSAYRGFFGNNHFRLANEFLIEHHVKPIEWTKSNLSSKPK